jgi:hypothetical protein
MNLHSHLLVNFDSHGRHAPLTRNTCVEPHSSRDYTAWDLYAPKWPLPPPKPALENLELRWNGTTSRSLFALAPRSKLSAKSSVGSLEKLPQGLSPC